MSFDTRAEPQFAVINHWYATPDTFPFIFSPAAGGGGSFLQAAKLGDPAIRVEIDGTFTAANGGGGTITAFETFSGIANGNPLPAHVQFTGLKLDGHGFIQAIQGGNATWGDYVHQHILNGNDHIYGGPGNDWLSGGAGRNIMSGGPGSNIFAFDVKPGKANLDIITDFHADDEIYLQHGVYRARYLPAATWCQRRFTSAPTLSIQTIT